MYIHYIYKSVRLFEYDITKTRKIPLAAIRKCNEAFLEYLPLVWFYVIIYIKFLLIFIGTRFIYNSDIHII